MSKGLLIDPLVLDPAEFPPLPLQPGFAQLVKDELGNVVTSADGFDQAVADAVAVIDALDGILTVMGNDLVDAFLEADLIDPQPVSDTVDGYTASLTPTSSAVDDLGTLVGTAAAPTPTPPSGGGGGGGGGTATTTSSAVVTVTLTGAPSPQILCFNVKVV
jgi:hypothetical protein